ncbi:Indole-3-acetaldehyde oxidase [Vitis vinifera]|uniref:Indole-3-acetaldehyde oxidase n=1 Tax=Vitis vinifera TaxID=29760 RepID=A0A438FGJ9_VITVI|nr:Indole-3-acetaldehyde oxidase [Vitis vinifera]
MEQSESTVNNSLVFAVNGKSLRSPPSTLPLLCLNSCVLTLLSKVPSSAAVKVVVVLVLFYCPSITLYLTSWMIVRSWELERWFHPIHERFSGFHASQCGFCTPGMCMSLFSALVNAEKTPRPEPPLGFSKLKVSEAERLLQEISAAVLGTGPLLMPVKVFSADVDMEDLGFNSFWRKGDSKEVKLSSLPLYNHSDEICTFPEFLKNETRSTLLLDSRRYSWYSPVSIEELQRLLGFVEDGNGSRDNTGISIGATVTISKAIEALREYNQSGFYSEGTWWKSGDGTKESFPSDIATVLLAVGSTVNIMNSLKSEELTLEEFLRRPELDSKSILVGVKIPDRDRIMGISSGTKMKLLFETYRAAPRPLGNALPYLNAALMAKVSRCTTSNGIIVTVKLLKGIVVPDDGTSSPAYSTLLSPAKQLDHGKISTLLSSAKQEVELNRQYHPVGEPIAKSGAAIQASVYTYEYHSIVGFMDMAPMGLALARPCRILQATRVSMPHPCHVPYSYLTSTMHHHVRVGLLLLQKHPAMPNSHFNATMSHDKSSPLTRHCTLVPSIAQGITFLCSRQEGWCDTCCVACSTYLATPAVSAHVLYHQAHAYDAFNLGFNLPHCPKALTSASTKPLARVKGIKLNPKSVADGVSALISFKDIPGENIGCKTIFGTEPLFADDFTRCAGEYIAFVVADTQKHANMAANLAVVDYDMENLEPPILSVEEAVRRSSFFEVPSFISPKQVGDFSRGMAKADHKILSAEIRLGSQYYFYMETQTALAIPDEDNCIVVYSSIQCPENAHTTISRCLVFLNTMYAKQTICLNQQWRAPGEVQATFISEAVIEHVASTLSMDVDSKRGISRVPIVHEVSLKATPGKVSILSDGSVAVEVGGIELGQGLWTKGLTAGSTTSECSCEAIRLCCNMLVERLNPIKENCRSKWVLLNGAH